MFVVWDSNSHMHVDRNTQILPGVFRQSMPSAPKRIHQTENPLDVTRAIVKIVEQGNIILEPFARAGTIVLTAKLKSCPAVGSKLYEYYTDAAAKRVAAMDTLPAAV